MKKYMFFLAVLSFQVSGAGNNFNTFAIKVNSFGTGYVASVDVPSVIREGDLVSITFKSDRSSSFITSGVLSWTHGGACFDDRQDMFVIDVLGIKKVLTPDANTQLEYVEPIGEVDQVVNMYDGRIGLAVARPSIYKCDYYASIVGKDDFFYGNGALIGAKYRVTKLGSPGVFSWPVHVKAYFTRRDDRGGWIDMSSLSQVANDVDLMLAGTIRGWCKLETKKVELNHKVMTPDQVNNNTATSKVRVACGGGAHGGAMLSLLSSGSDSSVVKINDSLSSKVSLSSKEVTIQKDSFVDIEVKSVLNVTDKRLIPGPFEGSEVLIVNFL